MNVTLTERKTVTLGEHDSKKVVKQFLLNKWFDVYSSEPQQILEREGKYLVIIDYPAAPSKTVVIGAVGDSSIDYLVKLYKDIDLK